VRRSPREEEQMGGTVIFLGAGATKSCQGPLTDEILPGMHQLASHPDWPGSLSLLKEFLEDQFHVKEGSPKELYAGLPLVMSLIDTALARRQALAPRWDLNRLAELREQIEFGIYDLLEERLLKGPTNNHWELLDRVYPAGAGAQPCVISTNYDLIVDAALMFLSEYRPDEQGASQGRFPDYRCDVSTQFYRNETKRFGTLLKLHGSLNWLYCKSCQRLELGNSESRKWLKIVTRMMERAHSDLKASFTADGAPCPTCGTKLRPLLIAPTHLKDYRNAHLAQVWYEAERVLREADRVIFVGYSLPEDDLEVVYLLKRSLARNAPRAPARITVVEYDAKNPSLPVEQHVAGRRYRALFGDAIEWNACGLDAWLARPGAA
jgi:hypothetical protein